MDTWRSPKPAEPASAEGGKLGAAETPLMKDLGEASWPLATLCFES